MKKKLICSILALSLALIPMGYLAPAQTVQAAGALDLVTTEDGVQIYTSSWWYQATEDTLIFKELNNPASYSMITKGSYVHEIGFVAGNGVFHYVNLYNGSEIVMTGYIDGQYFEQQSNAPTSIFPTLEVYIEDKGYTTTLTPYNPSKGIYLDETGAARNANGQEVSIITGELYVEPETVHIDLSGGLATGSGATAH